MNSYFNAGDWVVIGLYLFGIIGLGIWFGKDQRNTRDYFLGSRNIPWWGIGMSIVAAETSALTIIGVPAIAYGGGHIFLPKIIRDGLPPLLPVRVVRPPHPRRGVFFPPHILQKPPLGGARP